HRAARHLQRLVRQRSNLPPAPMRRSARREHDDAHSCKAHQTAKYVPSIWSYSVNGPKPEDGDDHVDATIRRIDPPRCCGMQAQQPGKARQACSSWYEEPGGAVLSKPQVGEIAP